MIVGVVWLVIALRTTAGKNDDDESAETSSSEESSQGNDSNQSDENGEVTGSDLLEDDGFVTELAAPADGDIVSGQIELMGHSSAGLGSLTAKAFDDNGNLLGETEVFLEAEGSNDIPYWTKTLYLSSSPETEAGVVVIYPRDNETSPLRQEVRVVFEVSEVSDRLRVIAPLPFQTFSGGQLTVRGQMKNFFEGLMNVRIIDNAGLTVFDQSINAEGENYSDFSDFILVADIGDLPSGINGEGVIEFYEISMADGSEIVVLAIPVYLR